MMWATRIALGIAIGGAIGCDLNSPTYFAPDAPLMLTGEEETPVTSVVEIEFRAPTAEEASDLAAESASRGFAVPWLKRSDLDIEVLYTLKNLGAEEVTTSVAVNGGNELYNYDLSAVLSSLQEAAGPNEDPLVLSLYEGVPRILKGNEVYHGVVREESLSESSLDLDAMSRWMAPYAAVLLNRSEENPVGLDMVPTNVTVPALFRVAFTCEATGPVQCEFLVRVRDNGDRLWHDGDTRFRPTPAEFTPEYVEP